MSKMDAFISHAWGRNQKGHRWANHLAERLKEDHGIYCWIDDQEENLLPGKNLRFQLETAIQDCPVFVAVLCNSYKSRANCMAELSHALNHAKAPIPILSEIVAESEFPEAFRDTVYLQMAEIADFDRYLPKLAKTIRRESRISKWVKLGQTLGIYNSANIMRHAYSITPWLLLGISLWAFFMYPLPARHDCINVPRDESLVTFKKGGGQGGLVDVEGSSKELKPHEVLLLVVSAPDGIDYPQTNQPRGIIPDANGDWTAEVQVGNDESEPLKDLKFTLRMYVLSEDEYLLLKKDNQDTGGQAKWPPDRLKVRPTEHAKTRFTLK